MSSSPLIEPVTACVSVTSRRLPGSFWLVLWRRYPQPPPAGRRGRCRHTLGARARPGSAPPAWWPIVTSGSAGLDLGTATGDQFATVARLDSSGGRQPGNLHGCYCSTSGWAAQRSPGRRLVARHAFNGAQSALLHSLCPRARSPSPTRSSSPRSRQGGYARNSPPRLSAPTAGKARAARRYRGCTRCAPKPV